MADQLIYGCAETGTYSTDAPNPNVELSGTVAPGYAVAQTFVSALSNAQTCTVTIRKDASNWAVYTGAEFTTGTPNLIDLSGATLAESVGALSDADAVEVLGLMPGVSGGADAALRHAWATPYSYCGQAPAGSAEAAEVWTITRLTISDAGAVTATETATNVAWDDRATATYA